MTALGTALVNGWMAQALGLDLPVSRSLSLVLHCYSLPAVILALSLAYWTGRTATGILCIWLATNLFLGCQVSWNLRPFFGSPSIEVQFLRPQPWRGNFYESTWSMVRQLSVLGTSESSFPEEKRFFLGHWAQSVTGSVD